MKSINYIPLVLVLIGLALRQAALWCTYKATSCQAATFVHTVFVEFINPIYTFSLFFLLPSILILFLAPHVVKAWLRFAAWWLPLSVVVIYIGSSGGDGLMPFYSYSPSEVAVPMAALFTIISLGIIGWKQFGSKK